MGNAILSASHKAKILQTSKAEQLVGNTVANIIFGQGHKIGPFSSRRSVDVRAEIRAENIVSIDVSTNLTVVTYEQVQREFGVFF